ncbi:MAG: GNAT family N-acetyltransferase [Dehalococcoidales bacterium]|jgi:hypothetical protein
MPDAIYQKAIKLLESDILKNVATLKYLTLNRKNASITLLQDKREWAVLSAFPTSILSYDTEVYPKVKVAVFLNGTSEQLKLRLLDTMPVNNYVLRLNEPLDLSGLATLYKVSRGFTYLSFSCTGLSGLPSIATVRASAKLTDEVLALFAQNGYREADIKKYFAAGARWFGFKEDNKIKSICFIYGDYGNVREIAGVRTQETARRKGYARTVVYSALKYLLERNMVPRYATEAGNTNSIKLAQSLGMQLFLRIEHYLLESK